MEKEGGEGKGGEKRREEGRGGKEGREGGREGGRKETWNDYYLIHLRGSANVKSEGQHIF